MLVELGSVPWLTKSIRSTQVVRVGESDFTCTMTHCIGDAKGWRMLISSGQIADLPQLSIQEVSLLVETERPIKEFVEKLTRSGFAHHCIAVNGYFQAYRIGCRLLKD